MSFDMQVNRISPWKQKWVHCSTQAELSVLLLSAELGRFPLDFDGVFLFAWSFGEKKKITVEFWGDIFVKKIIHEFINYWFQYFNNIFNYTILIKFDKQFIMKITAKRIT